MLLNDLIAICNPLDVSHKEAIEEITSFCLDSREAKEGSAFLAITGTEVDGHMFIEDAVQRGANVIICEDAYYNEDESICVIEVESTRKLAGPIAQAFYGHPGKKLKVIGITGTNGKTTTATLVYQTLRELGKAASLLGTVNKRILDEVFHSKLTTSDPISLAKDMKQMVEAGSEYLVMEVSSHALDQRRVAGFEFTVAAFTNLSHDHLDYHETMGDYAQAKKILFDELSEKATAVINADDAYAASMTGDCKAKIKELSYRTGTAQILKNSSAGLEILMDGYRINSSLIGTFNAYNVGMTYLICESLGLDPETLITALSKAKGADGRMEKVIIDSSAYPDVIVDYAHTPDALHNVLETLSTIRDEDQQLLVVFGAGGDRDTTKRPEMAKVADEFAERIFVTSDNPRSENPDLIIAEIVNGFESLDKVSSITSRREAIEQAIEEADDRDIVLIAGKGHETYQEINGVRHDFDDREIARECLLKRSGEVN